MLDGGQVSRLPRNFHRTFKPERRYIREMLRFAAAGKEGDYLGIAAATGIPTGTSSGKVPAILDYCRGMGLVRLEEKGRSAVKKPELTAFGRIVLLEDPFLKLDVTQWIAHFNLCSPRLGADVWYRTFVEGAEALGFTFGRKALDNHLGLAYGITGGNLVGPLIGTYEDDAALKACGALREVAGIIERKKAPLADEYGRAYGAWTLELLRTHFPDARQVPVPELGKATGWRAIPGWDALAAKRAMELMARKGLLDVDRHMEPWVVAPAATVEDAWKRIYDDQV